MSQIDIRAVSSEGELRKVLELERKTFEEEGFVSMDEYEKYLPQSHFFGAFTADEECIGMVRVIDGSPIPPPFLAHDMIIDRERERWEELAADGKLHEYATVAVERSRRGLPLFLDLVRVAYRDSKQRGATHYGLIMEPHRVQKLISNYHLQLFPVGPEQHYMGEVGMTAPYIGSFSEFESYVWRVDHDYADWYLNGSLTEPRFRPHRLAGSR